MLAPLDATPLESLLPDTFVLDEVVWWSDERSDGWQELLDTTLQSLCAALAGVAELDPELTSLEADPNGTGGYRVVVSVRTVPEDDDARTLLKSAVHAEVIEFFPRGTKLDVHVLVPDIAVVKGKPAMEATQAEKESLPTVAPLAAELATQAGGMEEYLLGVLATDVTDRLRRIIYAYPWRDRSA